MAGMIEKTSYVVKEDEGARDDDELHPHTSWHGDNAVPEVPDWESGVELKGPGLGSWIVTGLHLTFPTLFLAMSVYIASMNERPVRTDTTEIATATKEDYIYLALTQALKISVTIFPILFTLVLGRFLKTVVNYKAERGTHLITLEQLMASKSFGSAATAPFSFRRVNTTLVTLFLIWAISPITSQALQRLFSVTSSSFESSTTPVVYLNLLATQPPDIVLSPVISYAGGEVPALDYSNDTAVQPVHVETAIAFQSIVRDQSSTTKSSAIDLFGYPRIPLLSAVSANVTQDQDGWYDVGRTSSWPFSWGKSIFPKITTTSTVNLDWASITGQPVFLLPKNTSAVTLASRFTLTTGYWSLDCRELQVQTSEALGPASLWHTNFAGPLRSFASYENIYGNLDESGASLAMRLEFPPEGDNDALPVLHVASDIRSDDPMDNTVSWATTACTWARQVVDVEFGCVGGKCAAARMRQSAFSHGPPYDQGNQLVDIPGLTGNPQNMMQYIIHNLLSADCQDAQSTTYCVLRPWLYSEDASRESVTTTAASPDLSQVPAEIFSKRLSKLLNTFWAVWFDPDKFSVVSSEYMNIMDDEIDELTAQYQGLPPGYMRTVASVDHMHLVYHCNWGWLAIVIVSCAIVFAIIILDAILRSRTLAPDLLGYVNSLTFNNAYIPLPSGGGTIAGLDRSRKLAHLKVRIQDVTPRAELGHIALATVDGARLEKGRKYD